MSDYRKLVQNNVSLSELLNLEVILSKSNHYEKIENQHMILLNQHLYHNSTLALDADSGEEEGRYQIGDASRRWVYSSPLAWGGRVYTGVSSHFVALNQESGAVVWQRDDLGPDDWISSYASPAALGRRGRWAQMWSRLGCEGVRIVAQGRRRWA